MATERRLQVFVSSTFTDLKDERKAAVEAILEAGHIPAGMELFTAGDIRQWDLIKKWIAESDVYMLLVGDRYGTIGPKGSKSYTHMEFEYAKKLKKPMFSLVADAAFLAQKRRTHRSSPQDRRNAERLREIASKRTVTFFSNRDQVKTQVTQALGPFSSLPGITGWIRAPADSGPALLFPQSWRVGHGYLPDVEQAHSVSAIGSMLWDKPNSMIQIGSPYLRYWLDPTAPRLKWLLENTKHIKIQIALFEITAAKTKKYKRDRAQALTVCRAIVRKFPRRLSLRSSARSSDLSYIVYPLKELKGLTSRAMIGIQTREYNQRPFVELVYTSKDPPPLVMAAQALHGESYHA